MISKPSGNPAAMPWGLSRIPKWARLLRPLERIKCLLSPALSSISWKRGSEGSDASPLHPHLKFRIEIEMNTFDPPNEAGQALAQVLLAPRSMSGARAGTRSLIRQRVPLFRNSGSCAIATARDPRSRRPIIWTRMARINSNWGTSFFKTGASREFLNGAKDGHFSGGAGIGVEIGRGGVGLRPGRPLIIVCRSF